MDRGQRTVGQVPDGEIRTAMINLVQEAGSVATDELFTKTARIFGWARRGQDITNRVEWVLRRIEDDDAVRIADGVIRLSPRD